MKTGTRVTRHRLRWQAASTHPPLSSSAASMPPCVRVTNDIPRTTAYVSPPLPLPIFKLFQHRGSPHLLASSPLPSAPAPSPAPSQVVIATHRHMPQHDDGHSYGVGARVPGSGPSRVEPLDQGFGGRFYNDQDVPYTVLYIPRTTHTSLPSIPSVFSEMRKLID